ncbi:MAG: DEAD/DEAH box helicase family protein [Acetobacter sp.]|nr:DEAD/DEAH box helicase family protein [Acetobacter sp.]
MTSPHCMTPLNELDTRAELIDPALASAGWGQGESHIKREYAITAGRLIGNGKRQKPYKADYVLFYRKQALAVVEAKRSTLSAAEGVSQAKIYAKKLDVRFTYATNGRSIYAIDMLTGQEGEISHFPTPQELWARRFANDSPDEAAWRDRFSRVPYEEKGGTWSARYYQDIAIRRVLDAIAAGQKRILLTLATGTGKTFIAFQIAWKLFQSRWNNKNNTGNPDRRPRILFLADRNILADQAFNAFSPFGEACIRIDPERLKKTGKMPHNAAVFFTIFQTFMVEEKSSEKIPETTPEKIPEKVPQKTDTTDQHHKDTPNASRFHFYDYAPDFFDFIIIDECHRGGAREESTWRGILEYFAPAVQLGLTATPKRADNADTYAYFGEPVYRYSLRDGIDDGYLTPFKVRQIATTLDEYVYTSDDFVLEGDVEQGRRYTESDFNRDIQILEREKYRVQLFMNEIAPYEKTIVFCATQEHAALIRDLINQRKSDQNISTNPDYCVRVTAADNKAGEDFLKQFQDNEKTIPAILTTSQKLSTGVDARNLRNIVLLRPVGSMIEFKQIVGRGTRLYEGKDYFTIYDFVKAYEHFNDPEWDGDPLKPETPEPPKPSEPKPPKDGKPKNPEEPEEPSEPKQILKIKLADGKERRLQHMSATMFYSPEGRPLSAQEFIERLYGELPRLFKDEDELRRLWGNPETRRTLLTALEERGFGKEALKDIRAMVANDKSDLFDVLAYIAFARPTMTRQERADAQKEHILAACDDKLRSFIDFVLGQYVTCGIEELEQNKLPDLLRLKYGGIPDATRQLNAPILSIQHAFTQFQQLLFEKRTFM